MKSVNALELRQSLGKVVERLERTGEPVMLHKGRRPVGVLISLKDFEERFVEKAAADARDEILSAIDRLARRAEDKTPAVQVLRGLRGSG